MPSKPGLKIVRYPALIEGSFVVGMPEKAGILSVQVEHGKLFLYALGNPSNKQTVRQFRVITTDEEFKPQGTFAYLGTFQLPDRNPRHLFEIE